MILRQVTNPSPLARLQAKLEADIEKLAARLASPGFAGKAPPAVVKKAEDELSEMRNKLESVLDGLSKLP